MELVILRTARITEGARKRLEACFAVREARDCGEEEALVKGQVLWAGVSEYVGRDVMAKMPQLRMIATPATGHTHIDEKEAARRGIQIESLRDKTLELKEVRATAEHAVALLLAVLRKIPFAHKSVAQGEWRRDDFIGGEVYGKSVGIIGYGRLGRLMAKYMRAFGGMPSAYDPFVREADVPLLALEELLRNSEIITIHASLHRNNHQMIGEREFGWMKPGAVLVNTARGELIDENALLRALKSGKLAGAGLDVVSNEFALNGDRHPLVLYAKEHDNLVLTPHIGGLTYESRTKTDGLLAEHLCKKYGRGYLS